jgi:hypothetical protein
MDAGHQLIESAFEALCEERIERVDVSSDLKLTGLVFRDIERRAEDFVFAAKEVRRPFIAGLNIRCWNCSKRFSSSRCRSLFDGCDQNGCLSQAGLPQQAGVGIVEPLIGSAVVKSDWWRCRPRPKRPPF